MQKNREHSVLYAGHLLTFYDSISSMSFSSLKYFKADITHHSISFHKYSDMPLHKLRKFSYMTTILSAHQQS